MLVLSRGRSESIMIGDEYVVTPLRIRDEGVTIVVSRELGDERFDASIHTLARDQFIDIDERVRVTVIDVRDERVRFGVEAPASLPVHRLEVYEQIKRENRNPPHDKNRGDDFKPRF